MALRILSDLHLGVNPSFAYPNRERILLEKLQSWHGSDELILAGDVFEFWMEYTDYIAKAQFPFLKSLRDLVDSGTKVHYIAGNHDFDLGRFFEEYIGVNCHPSGQLELERFGQKILIGHGDGWAKSDWKYRIVRKVIRHPISGKAFRLLHPDWGMALARFVGRESRNAGMHQHIPFDEYKEKARADLCNGFDLVLQGHLHHPLLEKWEEGIFVCNGPWLDRLYWTEIDADGVKIWDEHTGVFAQSPWINKP